MPRRTFPQGTQEAGPRQPLGLAREPVGDNRAAGRLAGLRFWGTVPADAHLTKAAGSPNEPQHTPGAAHYAFARPAGRNARAPSGRPLQRGGEGHF